MARLQRGQHLRGDVERRAGVQRVGHDHVETSGLRIGLDFLDDRALQLPERLVTADIQVFEELVLLARELALAVAQRLLRVAALVLGHHRAVLLQLLLAGLEFLLLVLQIAPPARELVLERGRGGLGLRRFLPATG